MVVLPSGVVAPDFYPVSAWEEVFVAGGRPWSADNQAMRVYLFTGDEHESYGSFTLSTAAILPAGVRPICVAMAAWTMPEYAFGYTIPEPPPMWIYQSAYDTVARTVTISWEALGKHLLRPQSNYSINVICPARSRP
jgi:hypothetical protein